MITVVIVKVIIMKVIIIIIVIIIAAIIIAIIKINYYIVKIFGISKNCVLNKCGSKHH